MKFKILFLFLHFSIFGISQEIPPPSIALDSLYAPYEQFDADSILEKNPTTQNAVFPKNFDEKFQNKYKGADFDYTTVKPSESLWQKLQKRIRMIIESFFGKVDPIKSASYAENILRFIAIVIIGFVLYFLIQFLLNKEGNFFFGKKNKKIKIAHQDLHENIHEINFKESILDFERQKDYRSAIRYHFLFVLKRLSDQKLINWNPEKTNKEYLSELKIAKLKSGFQELSYIFDYVWYGDFDVNEERYRHFEEKFSQFKI
jgi:hypothetical protein